VTPLAKLGTFWSCAATLGRTAAERAAIIWHLSKNVRVRLGLARYHPDDVFVLQTRIGPVHLRDNFGDVTNLPGLLAENIYRAGTLTREGAIIDCGANIGLFSKWMRAHNPGRPIHCFEPLPSNARMIRLNCPDATVNEAGVGRAAATVRLGVDKHGLMASSIAQAWSLEETEFPVVTLDDYASARGIGPVAFLKIDTEGMELDVLDGAHNLLRRTERVAMETHGDTLHRGSIDRLTAAGLTIDGEERTGAATGLLWASRRDSATSATPAS
jgi:FkbM family methyltransferase